jgi:nucleoside-diphosphate-sugar epimerase
MLEKVKNAQPCDGNAGRIINLIHRDDGIKAILACLLSAETNLGRIYNVTDGNHSPRGQIVQWLAGKLSVDSPAFAEDDDENTPNRKVSTNRIMEELEWSPQFSSFIEGYENLLS